MVSVYDVEAEPLIKEVADELKDDFKAPEWTQYVKTGVDRERTPQQDDWYHIRAAAVLRKVYLEGPLGVSKLRTIYGGRKSDGHGPEHHGKASGKVIRTVLQKLEKTGYVEKEESQGRKITKEGKSFLDEKSSSILGE